MVFCGSMKHTEMSYTDVELEHDAVDHVAVGVRLLAPPASRGIDACADGAVGGVAVSSHGRVRVRVRVWVQVRVWVRIWVRIWVRVQVLERDGDGAANLGHSHIEIHS